MTSKTTKATRFELPAELPDDPKVLKALLIEVCAMAQREIDDLREQVEYLKSPRSSASPFDPNQTLLPFAQPPVGPPRAPEAVSHEHEEAEEKKKGHGRRPWPEKLPRQQEEIRPAVEDLRCRECGGDLKRIGEEVTREVEYKPASYFVREIVRPKFACAPCQGNVVIADLPPRPILKGRPGAGMLAHVVVSKYADHLPLERQAGMMRREGVDIAPSTLCDWVGAMEEMYARIREAMRGEALASGHLHSDYTPVPVLAPGTKQAKTGQLGVNVGGGHVVFHYSPDKTAEGFARFLGEFKGHLQCDASGTNLAQAKGEGVTIVGCWAHSRRHFKDAVATSPGTATEAMQYIKALYKVEEEGKGLDPEKRKALRQEKSEPILKDFLAWLEAKRLSILPKSPMGEAVGYTLNQWTELTRYLEDGRLAIDNNVAERNLRCVALGRGNWLFAGSDEGALRAAVMYSLVQSCKLHGIDPFEYFRDTIGKLATHPARELTPKAWKAARVKGRAEMQAPEPATTAPPAGSG